MKYKTLKKYINEANYFEFLTLGIYTTKGGKE